MSSEYIKIKTLYMRDPHGKIIVGEYADPVFKYLKDCVWTATEKIDGQNTRIMWDGHRITWNGATDNANIADFETKWLTDKFGSPETEELFEQTFGEKPVVLYGEFYGHRIMKAGEVMDPTGNGIIFFDAKVNGFWVNYSVLKTITEELGLSIVPKVKEGTLVELAKDITENGISLHETISGKSAPLEGYVCFPSIPLFYRDGTPIKVKIKVRDLVSGGYKL